MFQDETKFVVVRATLLVTIPPKHGDNVRQGIYTALSHMLFRYLAAFQGVPFSFSNIVFKHDYAYIYSDNPFLHIKLSGSFLVFRPVVGARLRGEITRIHQDHVGLVIYGTLNGFIPSDQLEKTHQWNSQLQAWSCNDKQLAVGQKISFIVLQIEFAGDIATFRGTDPLPE